MVPRDLTHIDPLGRTRMMDSAPKEISHRRALARCRVSMKPETTAAIASNASSKGDVLGVARVAGIQAAKQTALLIPLCHPLLLGSVYINFVIGDHDVEVEAQVETYGGTGVEMEAMTACTVAALTIYDMCKSTDRTMAVTDVKLWEKTGGSAGVWRRPSSTLETRDDDELGLLSGGNASVQAMKRGVFGDEKGVAGTSRSSQDTKNIHDKIDQAIGKDASQRPDAT